MTGFGYTVLLAAAEGGVLVVFEGSHSAFMYDAVVPPFLKT